MGCTRQSTNSVPHDPSTPRFASHKRGSKEDVFILRVVFWAAGVVGGGVCLCWDSVGGRVLSGDRSPGPHAVLPASENGAVLALVGGAIDQSIAVSYLLLLRVIEYFSATRWLATASRRVLPPANHPSVYPANKQMTN